MRDMYNFHGLLRLVLSISSTWFHLISFSIDYFNITSVASFRLVYTLTSVNPFHAICLFLYPLETSEKVLWLFLKTCFQGVWKETSSTKPVNSFSILYLIHILQCCFFRCCQLIIWASVAHRIPLCTLFVVQQYSCVIFTLYLLQSTKK